MGRLVVAVLILFAVLAGLRVANSSLFQRNVANQINSAASDTRSIGFSAEATDASSGSGSSGVSSQPASTQNFNQTGTAAPTTALPPRQQPAVNGSW